MLLTSNWFASVERDSAHDYRDLVTDMEDAESNDWPSLIQRYERWVANDVLNQGDAIRHDSRMVARCSGVSDASLRADIADIADVLVSRLSALEKTVAVCQVVAENDSRAADLDCPDVPDLIELLLGDD